MYNYTKNLLQIIHPFHIPFTYPCYTDIEPRKEIYVIYTTCLVVYHQEKTQNADFAGDFTMYVDDYAEWICHQAFDRRSSAVARQNAQGRLHAGQ